MINQHNTNVQLDSIKELVTLHPITVSPFAIMTEVEQLFNENNFHHIPVVNEEKECVGIISKSDYLQLQDKFTRWDLDRINISNKRFMRSLIAQEVMTENPTCLDLEASMDDVLAIFLENKFHAIPINKNDEFYGILTTFDLLKFLKELK